MYSQYYDYPSLVQSPHTAVRRLCEGGGSTLGSVTYYDCFSLLYIWIVRLFLIEHLGPVLDLLIHPDPLLLGYLLVQLIRLLQHSFRRYLGLLLAQLGAGVLDLLQQYPLQPQLSLCSIEIDSYHMYSFLFVFGATRFALRRNPLLVFTTYILIL